MNKIIIVGGGIGGLCSAVRLLYLGYEVILIEKENKIGGKINRIEDEGYKFDLTASIMMTPHIYKDIFDDINKVATNYLDFINVDDTYRVFYSDNTVYDFYADKKKMKNTLNNIEKDLDKDYFELIEKSYENYIKAKKDILDKPMISFKENLNVNLIKDLIEISPLVSSYDYIKNKIKNEKIRKFLIFQSMYIGVNPYNNSNIYTLIPAITQREGLAYIKGGMYEYILALEKIILELGGNIILNKEVDNIIIKNNKAVGVKIKEEEIIGDAVVCNADYPYAIKYLINESINQDKYNKENIDEMNYSCSVFMLYLGLDKKYDKIKLHNIYINENFKENMEDAFNDEIPNDPSIYIYSPSAIDDTICKEGCSTINIMLRVPNLSNRNIVYDKKTIAKIRNNIISILKGIKGLEDIDKHIDVEKYLTPLDLKNNFNSYYGSAFGLGHKLLQSGYFRPHLKSNKVKNLYFIGSSTHPGNGTSVIIDGSRVLVNIIDKDFRNKKDDV